MKSSNLRAIKGIICTLLTTGLLTGSAALAATAGAGPTPLPYGWTLEKMRKAIPYPMPQQPTIPYRAAPKAAPQAMAPRAQGPLAVATPGWIPSRPPDGWTNPLITDNPAGTFPPPAPTLDHITDYVPQGDMAKFPHTAAGKVFFSAHDEYFTCSGSVIGENVIWTAGHCIADERGVFHNNWMFMPGFNDSVAPYGAYTALYATTPTEYSRDINMGHDYAVVGVKPYTPSSAGPPAKSLMQTVGAVGFAWNMPREQQWLVLGYPNFTLGGPYQFFGKVTYYEDETFFKTSLVTPASMCVGHALKGGVSGGPWLLNPMLGEAGEANYMNGISSYISFATGNLCSPYLGDQAKRLWDCAQNSTPERPVCPDSMAATNLLLTHSADNGPIPVGGQFTYTLKLENLGPADATHVVLTDNLPKAVVVASVDLPGGACSLDNSSPILTVITCTLDALPSGATVTATVQVNGSARGSYQAMASVTSDQSGEWATGVGTVTDVHNGTQLTVTNTNDSGPGSLREAIDTIESGGTIDFDPTLSGAVIHLATSLSPWVVTIDGSALSEPITISGDTDGDGAGDTRVFELAKSVWVTMDSLIITKGHAATFEGGLLWWGGGGGINNNGTLVLKNCTITENSSDYAGGGIFNWTAATLTVLNSTFSGNTAPYGGGLFINSGGEGGDDTDQGMVRLKGSTLSGNSATTDGGAIENLGRLAISNSTLAQNSAIDRSGGGIVNFGRLGLLNSTLSGNSSASAYVGGLYNGGTLNFANTIIANSRGAVDCYSTGTISTNSHNLVEDGTCSEGGIQFTTGDPILGPLADNGGVTSTLALLPGSPAIDAGDDAVCAAAPINNASQNRIPRLQGTHCDIGANEAYETLTFRSVAADDGWVLESSAASEVGGYIHADGLLRAGDDSHNRQYRSLMHFETGLPANAVITRATLRVKQRDAIGAPFTAHNNLIADIRKGSFGNRALERSDFEFLAASGQLNNAGRFSAVGDGWYQLVLGTRKYQYIDPAGATQFRLRFAVGDDHDGVEDCVRFFADNAPSANRPRLIIRYYVKGREVTP